jgi:hypothetical protein
MLLPWLVPLERRGLVVGKTVNLLKRNHNKTVAATNETRRAVSTQTEKAAAATVDVTIEKGILIKVLVTVDEVREEVWIEIITEEGVIEAIDEEERTETAVVLAIESETIVVVDGRIEEAADGRIVADEDHVLLLDEPLNDWPKIEAPRMIIIEGVDTMIANKTTITLMIEDVTTIMAVVDEGH